MDINRTSQASAKYVPVAQMEEHVTFNHGVESSSLSGHTTIADVAH